MPVLLSDVRYSNGVKFGCVISKILGVKLNFSRLRICVVVVYPLLKKRTGSGMYWRRCWIKYVMGK